MAQQENKPLTITVHFDFTELEKALDRLINKFEKAIALQERLNQEVVCVETSFVDGILLEVND